MLQVQRPLDLDVLFWAGVSFTSSWEAEVEVRHQSGYTSVATRLYISLLHQRFSCGTVRRGGEETGGGGAGRIKC